MTTKPTSRKFRIKRSPSQTPPDAARPAERQTPSGKAAPAPAPKAQPQQSPGNVALELDAIRREGLTGRQLRLARRVAHKNGLAPTSDIDAVRLLRARGIDPFKRTNMLELVVQKDDDAPRPKTGDAADQRVQLPQTVPDNSRSLPSPDLSPVERRTIEISQIQADITRRRQKKNCACFARGWLHLSCCRHCWRLGISFQLPRRCMRPSLNF